MYFLVFPQDLYENNISYVAKPTLRCFLQFKLEGNQTKNYQKYQLNFDFKKNESNCKQ